MLLISALFSVAMGAAQIDPCALLCNRDGPAVCTGGSWTKIDGTCHAYVFRGDSTGTDYCYHTTASAAACPAGGPSVRSADVDRLMRADATTSAPRYSTPPSTQTPRDHRPETTVPTPSAEADSPIRRDERFASFLAAFNVEQVEDLCAAFHNIEGCIRGGSRDADLSGVDPVEYWNRVNGPRLLEMAARPSSCRQALVRAMLLLATRIVHSVPPSASSGFVQASGLSRFCIFHSHVLQAAVEQDGNLGPIVADFFPTLFNTRSRRLGLLYYSIDQMMRSLPPANPLSLLIDGDRTFSDSVDTLNNAQVGSLVRLPVVQDGMNSRAWFSAVARHVFSGQSTGPAGGLFVPRAGTQCIELNVSRPYEGHMRGVYFALGRFLAMSIVLRIPLGVPLPRMFFTRLVGRSDYMTDLEFDDPVMYNRLARIPEGGQDMEHVDIVLEGGADVSSLYQYIVDALEGLFPEQAALRIDVIREGFVSIIPLSVINPVITSDDLHWIVSSEI